MGFPKFPELDPPVFKPTFGSKACKNCRYFHAGFFDCNHDGCFSKEETFDPVEGLKVVRRSRRKSFKDLNSRGFCPYFEPIKNTRWVISG